MSSPLPHLVVAILPTASAIVVVVVVIIIVIVGAYYPPLHVIYLIVVCMSSSLAVSSPRSPPAPSLRVILLIVDLIRCRQWCCHRHHGRCVGSSLAATAAKDDRIEVDDEVELLLLSALPPPFWRQIKGQRHAAKVPRLSPLL